ncbi:Gfo/Idh/MocA family oxidoreductase [Paenibacillus algorifonticola]|uniref:Gfo/Idh/MocA family protein n=1 Tax=Paenibacillus algorifonticola TaxID=684063 RepID=UPI003D280F47
MKPVRIGIIGCGNISSIYFEADSKFPILDIVACADLDIERARAQAEKYGIPLACSVEELLAKPDIELILNLTIPSSHADIHLKALAAGKHTYGEKPLAIELEESKQILDLAAEKGLLVGSAPDTFLGGVLQTGRKLIDDGWIGKPISANAFLMSHGPESFHPNPDFFYQKGAGPLFDMGPYYLTALIHLMGPVKRVTGSAASYAKERMVTSEVNYGRRFPVETPTHVSGVLDFQNGAIATMVMSFDVWGTRLPFIEIHGTTGSMILSDPNEFGGKVLVKRQDYADFVEMPLTHGFTTNNRGIGLMDMAFAIREGRAHRASGELGYHVLEVMHGFYISSDSGQHYQLSSVCKKPELLPLGLTHQGFNRLE